MPRSRSLTCPPLVLAVMLAAPADGEDPRWRPTPLAREAEIAAALTAAPAAVAGGAGVYVLTERGYELARESENGFHCIVGRDVAGAFEPQCFDAEGSASLLPRILLEGELRMGGASEAEVARAVGEAWASGRLRAPGRSGINYMLSKDNRVPAGDRVIPYRPHVMIYVPYLTNADLGGAMDGSSPVFVINEGEPGAYLIVPVPEESLRHAH